MQIVVVVVLLSLRPGQLQVIIIISRLISDNNNEYLATSQQQKQWQKRPTQCVLSTAYIRVPHPETSFSQTSTTQPPPDRHYLAFFGTRHRDPTTTIKLSDRRRRED